MPQCCEAQKLCLVLSLSAPSTFLGTQPVTYMKTISSPCFHSLTLLLPCIDAMLWELLVSQKNIVLWWGAILGEIHVSPSTHLHFLHFMKRPQLYIFLRSISLVLFFFKASMAYNFEISVFYTFLEWKLCIKMIQIWDEEMLSSMSVTFIKKI